MTAIMASDVRRASAELARMRGALTSWLRVRDLNDQVLAGTLKTRQPLAYAQQVVSRARDLSVEQDLATKLHALLSVVMAGRTLPEADVHSNPQAAVELAQIAIAGTSGPTSLGGMSPLAHPWLWPAIIVGGLLLTVTTAIKTAADVAKDREEKACIQAGACTDYGFWLKAGGIAMLAWVFWTKMGGREMVDSLTRKGR